MSLVQTPETSIFENVYACSTCHHVCIPPFEVCETGHLLCSGCITHHSMSCQQCNKKMIQSPIPALEQLINASFFHCKYSTDGCKKIIKGSKLRRHQLTCEYRNIECCWYFCTDKVHPHSKYIDALEAHGLKLSEGTKIDVLLSKEIISEPEGPLLLMHTKGYGHHFFFNLSRQDENAIMWVEMFGLTEESKNFQARLSLTKSMASTKHQINWTFPVKPVHMNLETMMNKGYCALLPYQVLSLFCEQMTPPKPRISQVDSKNETFSESVQLEVLILKNRTVKSTLVEWKEQMNTLVREFDANFFHKIWTCSLAFMYLSIYVILYALFCWLN